MFERIGFIGIGMMGTPMTRRLVEAGYAVMAYDIDAKALERAKDIGAETGTSPKDLAQHCNAVITMLPDSPTIENVVLGEEGIIHGAQKNVIFIDMSTAYPMSTVMLSKQLGKNGIRMLDAPVAGGVSGAEDGTLTIMVGGDSQLAEHCRPLFQVLGKNLIHMGEAGAGHTMKAANNFLSACYMAATSEAVALATKAGLDPQKVVETLQVCTGKSNASDVKFPKFVLTGTFKDGFRTELFYKDLEIATRLSRELRVPMLVANTVQQLFGLALSQGYGSMGHTSIARMVQEWAKVKMQSLR
jgi:3-hydroxyisobutyrate dehydrogenase-like beta-hydroxyacid dehydrogenase